MGSYKLYRFGQSKIRKYIKFQNSMKQTKICSFKDYYWPTCYEIHFHRTGVTRRIVVIKLLIHDRSKPNQRVKNIFIGNWKAIKIRENFSLTFNDEISWKNLTEYGSQALATTLHSSMPVTALVRLNSLTSTKILPPSYALKRQLVYPQSPFTKGRLNFCFYLYPDEKQNSS